MSSSNPADQYGQSHPNASQEEINKKFSEESARAAVRAAQEQEKQRQIAETRKNGGYS